MKRSAPKRETKLACWFFGATNQPTAMPSWFLFWSKAIRKGNSARRKGIAGGPQSLDEEKEYLLHKHVGLTPRGVDGLPFWAVMPDLVGLIDRDRPLDKFGVSEQKLHYIDVELFMADAAARKYAPDL